MRRFSRPLVICANCGAKIYWGYGYPDHFDADTLAAPGGEPPDIRQACPRCTAEVDTTDAYSAVPGFPVPFPALFQAFQGFAPVWEGRRGSFETAISELVGQRNDSEAIEQVLASQDGWNWYRQRMFYRSCTAFYRSLQLFLAFLVLERRCFVSWAKVTGYYSRFFIIQALLNLMLSTWDSSHRYFFFFDGKRVKCIPQSQLSPTIKKAHSHEIWWQLMEAVKRPKDYPIDHLDFILTRLVFNPQERNNVNYDFEYLQGGFIELDWFDSGAKQMLNHFMPRSRSDHDITDMNRFFGDRDPEDCDVADFYDDDAQILWCSLVGYLQLLSALEFKQGFILTENIAALAEIHLGNEYPNLMNGLLLSSQESLRDGFDVTAFIQDRQAHPQRFSSFY